MQTVADQFEAILAAVGVKRVYGIVGDSLNGLTDAIRGRQRIEWVHVRHEEVAAFAAGADAHVTGELAVCAGSCGPGNLHLINGLFDCHRSRVPVLAIAAQIPSAEMGSGYFQETHPQELFRECSHYCELIGSAEQMQRTVEIAIREAVAKRGVSVVVLPGDVALQPAPDLPLPAAGTLALPAPAVVPSRGSLLQLSGLLNDAERVTVLCGSGCAGAREALLALGARLLSPMVHALRGKEHVEPENAFDVGMTGLLGFSSGYYAMRDCDALLMLGTDFPYRQFYPDGSKTKIAQVDIRAENIGRRAHVDVGVIGDVSATLEALLPLLDAKVDERHLVKARTHYANARASLDALAKPSTRGIVHPQQVASAIDDLAGDDAIFTCDVGLPTLWAARYVRMKERRRLIGSFWHGSMANAMAQAIGAQKAKPGREVIALCGDGGFAMLMGDLLTLRQLDLPVKVIVFDNSALGFIELEQKSSGFLNIGTELQNPDFAAMAEACGVRGLRVEDPELVHGTLRAALEHPGPVVVDAVVNRSELAMPPSITAQMARGFSLYMLKAILGGRGDEVVDLAQTNLWR